MTIKTLLCGSAFALSAALALPPAATAQTSGVASASPVEAIFSSKAWIAALPLFPTTYKLQFDQINVKIGERQALLALLDKNGDKQVDDAEMAANAPVVSQVATVEQDITALDLQVKTAQAFVLDTIAERYKTAQNTVIRDRKISYVLAPDAFVFAPNGTDITKAITAEIDRVLPTTSLTPPPNWQVTAQGAQLVEQWAQQVQQQQAIAQQQAAQRAPAAPAVTPGAAAVPARAAPPRAGAPAAGPPARGAPQQPATR